MAIWTLNSFLRTVAALTTTGTSGHTHTLRVSGIFVGSYASQQMLAAYSVLLDAPHQVQEAFVVAVSHLTSTSPSMFRSASLKEVATSKVQKEMK